MSKLYDVAVVGGGVVGLAHAYVAANAGKKVIVIERDVRANGASIRNFGFITVTGQERGMSWQLARRTRDLWAQIAPQAHIPIEHSGLYVTARSDEAMAVLDAFLGTEMGEGCSLVTADEFRRAYNGLGGSELKGALYSPHELRLESRLAIPLFAAFLKEKLNVTFQFETAVYSASPPCLKTSRGDVHAAAVVICPGDDFSTLYPERISQYALQRCRLSMLRLDSPGFRLPGAIMSDLGLARYRGYSALPEAKALEAKLRAEQPRHFENGVHLIVVQSADNSLVVGDSHHYDQLPAPFAPATAEDDILDEYSRALGKPAPAVTGRWTGTYAVADDRTFLIDQPEDMVRMVIVTSGTGASTALGIAEMVIGDLCNVRTGAAS